MDTLANKCAAANRRPAGQSGGSRISTRQLYSPGVSGGGRALQAESDTKLMKTFFTKKWPVVRSFLISLGIFVALVWLFFLSKGILVAFFAALIAPLLPPLFAISEWGSVQYGLMALQMAVLSCIVGVMVCLSILCFLNRIVFFTTHVLLIVYWVMCFGILGMAAT